MCIRDSGDGVVRGHLQKLRVRQAGSRLRPRKAAAPAWPARAGISVLSGTPWLADDPRAPEIALHDGWEGREVAVRD